MEIETTILATDHYDLESLTNKFKLIEEYLFEDETGHISLESAKLDSYENIRSLTNYLFKSSAPLTEIFQDNSSTVFDLSNRRKAIATFEELENFYPQWLKETNRDNSMDEYGMLIGFIGYIQRHKDKKFLLMIIDEK